MKVVWQLGRPTVREVFDAVADDTGWARPTVKTMLARMEQKGLLREVAGPVRRYAATRTRRTLVSRSVARHLDLVLDGSLAPLVGYIAKSRGLSSEDVTTLERLLSDVPDEEDS